ncbi:MAG TPA: amidohydrolase family protein, partial [Gemmatimonadota bacterium]|nr:amidohydrolase family protein [Gemmatimonadota bacterium]
MSGAALGVLLRGRVLSPVDATRAEAFEDGFVAIGADGTIAGAGAWPVEFDPRAAIDAGRALILPALVDAHVHLPQLPVRARYGDPLLTWLARHVYPAESAFADGEHAAREAARFFDALAAAGTGTAAVFSTVHAEATQRAFEAAAASGLRVGMGNVLMDREAPAELLEWGAEGVRATLDLAERWEGAA